MNADDALNAGSLEAEMIDPVTLRIRVPAEATRFLVDTRECSDRWTRAVNVGPARVDRGLGACKR